MKKLSVCMLMLFVVAFAFAGGENEQAQPGAAEAGADATSGPTQAIVTEPQGLIDALSPQGPWIIIFEDDMTVDQELVVSGEVYEEVGAEAPRRKFALYAQDQNRNITERYKLTAPRLVVRHENTRLQGGMFEGDVVVEADGFNLVDATVDGNVYFASEALRDTFEMDDNSTVTGSVEVGMP